MQDSSLVVALCCAATAQCMGVCDKVVSSGCNDCACMQRQTRKLSLPWTPTSVNARKVNKENVDKKFFAAMDSYRCEHK